MESFIVLDDNAYMCAGTLCGVHNACTKIESGAEPPTVWDLPPTTHCGGTVLIHDVDMRIPARSGAWVSGRLFNYGGDVCGGMVWHSSVGGAEEAAGLLRAMEDAGAPVICNSESPQVLEQGIRFIGRYSWQDDSIDPTGDRLAQCYRLNNGPEFFFCPPKVFRETIAPKYLSDLEELDRIVEDYVKEQQDAGVAEAYPGELRAKIEYAANGSPEAELTRHLRPPAVTVYGNAAVGHTFPNQEYLFGRVWLDPVTRKCYAVCFYTYATPDFFALCRVEGARVCPAIPPCRSPDRETSDNSDFNLVMRDPLAYIAKEISSLGLAELLAVMQGMTSAFRDEFLIRCYRRDKALMERLCTEGVVSISEKIFDLLMRTSSYETVDEGLALLILRHTSDSVLAGVAAAERSRFSAMQERLRTSPKSPFSGIDSDYIAATRPSHLASHLSRPLLLEELLKRGYPAGSVLAETCGEWPRTALSEAALEGHVDAVLLLLSYGADIEERLGEDPWNVIVYACASGNQELVDKLKEKFPLSEMWSRTDIPLNIKMLPNPFEGIDDEPEPLEEELYGSIEELMKKFSDERAGREGDIGM